MKFKKDTSLIIINAQTISWWLGSGKTQTVTLSDDMFLYGEVNNLELFSKTLEPMLATLTEHVVLAIAPELTFKKTIKKTESIEDYLAIVPFQEIRYLVLTEENSQTIISVNGTLAATIEKIVLTKKIVVDAVIPLDVLVDGVVSEKEYKKIVADAKKYPLTVWKDNQINSRNQTTQLKPDLANTEKKQKSNKKNIFFISIFIFLIITIIVSAYVFNLFSIEQFIIW